MKQKTLRNTALRNAILKIFAARKKPLTIMELTDLLAEEGFFPNKTTLYRQMETLTAIGKLHQVTLASGVMHYELATHHHHHFVCTDCNQTLCVEDADLEKQIIALEQKLKQRGLAVEEHHFSMSGLCKNCI